MIKYVALARGLKSGVFELSDSSWLIVPAAKDQEIPMKSRLSVVCYEVQRSNLTFDRCSCCQYKVAGKTFDIACVVGTENFLPSDVNTMRGM
jgi:hypothetical protein